VRSVRERLAFLGVCPNIEKCALTAADVTAYHLPPAMTKKKDTRSGARLGA